MISREDLLKYSDMAEYLNTLKDRKERYLYSINKLSERIREIEAGETVIDSVKGGSGGIQTFRIEGFPSREYSKKKTRLLEQRLKLEEAQCLIEEQEEKISNKVLEIEEFLAGIEDVKVKRIISLRCIDGKNWNEVADEIGGNASEHSVRMVFNRFIEKNSKNF